ncbi:hypothetical protein MPSEU_000071900 [Mayamaea pseudoterrestris]|nr:hypothetical protein MPSEU_000071900 [Mayamaea pseudoterrestris]
MSYNGLAEQSMSSNSSTHLRIRLHAANLPRQGRFLKSPPDTFVVVTSLTGSSGAVVPNATSRNGQQQSDSIPQGVIWGRTETVYKSSHPQWTECIAIDYVPHQELYFYVHIFQDECNEKDDTISATTGTSHESCNRKSSSQLRLSQRRSISQQPLDFTKSLGSAIFEVSNVLASSQHTRVKRLRSGGCIFCRLEQYATPGDNNKLDCLSQRFILQLAALQLDLPGQSKHALLSKRRRRRKRPVPLLVELAKRPAGRQAMMWVVTHRSSVVYSSSSIGSESDFLTVVWEEDDIDLMTLCHGDVSQSILITVKSVSSTRGEQSNMKVIGVTETSLQHLLRLGELARDLPLQLHYNNNDDDESLTPVRRQEQLSAAVTGEADDRRSGSEDLTESYLDDSSSDDDDDDEHVASGQASGQDGQEAPLRPNELLLQRSQVKMKRVGRLQVLKAELISTQYDDETFQHVSPLSPMNGNVNEVVDLAKLQSTIAIQPRADPARFQHYLDQGLELDFCVAIDFTSSNGNPREEGTNHYQDPAGALNDYEETILAVGKAVEAYSRSKEYLVWGFGAKFHGAVRHLFQLGPKQRVQGVDGILNAYRSVFASDFIMSGPTLLMEVMQKAAIQAKMYQADESPSKLRYNVLLIITDGLADSFEETQRKVSVYTQVPLTIVIVGVGDASSDFQKMYELVTTHRPRRNLSFVEFSKHQDHPGALGAAALQDLPSQVSEYMSMRGL